MIDPSDSWSAPADGRPRSTSNSGPSQSREGRSNRGDRLPPPAFPPGHRRSWVHRPRRVGPDEGMGGGTIPEDAFYSPDAPLRRIESLPDDDVELLPHSEEEGSQPLISPLSDESVAQLLENLAREIRDYDGGRFLWRPDVSPLEGAVRGLLSGYLRLGRREGERS
jgi:hypothetical protein